MARASRILHTMRRAAAGRRDGGRDCCRGRGTAGRADVMRTPTYAEVLISVPPLAAVIEETLRTRQPILRRVIDLKAHGLRTSAAQLGVTVSPIVHVDGRFQGLICLFTDLSTVVQLEEQLRLRESLAQVGEMTAGIAHEFRNSLATIHGYARLIDLGALSERDRTCVEGIQQEANALGEVVTNFLHFARPVDVSMEVIDLRTVLERAMDDVRAEVASRGGSLDLTGPGVRVEGDEVLLRQAFGNLVSQRGRSLRRAWDRARHPCRGAGESRSPADAITIADNGPGVAPAARDRMFQPFFTTKAKGTGLGLALVQKIIVIHNGRITPSHPERGGLRMEVALPLVESASSPRDALITIRLPDADRLSRRLIKRAAVEFAIRIAFDHEVLANFGLSGHGHGCVESRVPAVFPHAAVCGMHVAYKEGGRRMRWCEGRRGASR